MANQLVKFFRVSALPETGVIGALYFVHGTDGKGKLYICTAEKSFEDYTGLHTETNTTYDLKTVVNALKGQIQLVGSDETIDDVYVEGDGANIKVTSSADGIKVEHVLPTEGTALEAEEKKLEPGYEGTFTAVTSLTKDANGHIIDAVLETIQLPSADNFKTKQTAVADVAATGTDVTTVVTSVTQNENGEITVTKGTIPAESADVDSIDGVDGALTLRKGLTEIGSVNLAIEGKEIQASLVGSFEDGAQVNVLEGVKVNGNALKIGTGKAVDWKLVYNSDAKKLQVLDLNNSNAVVNEVDATAFIKDGMVSDAKIVWCTLDAEGKHVEADASDEGAIRCLRITFNTDAGKEAIHIPLNELTDVYTGEDGEITVSEANVIGLADVTPNNNDKVTKELGHSTDEEASTFAAITGVTVDTKGRVTGVETTTFTMPKLDIAEHTEEGEDDYVSVAVTTQNGGVTEVTVNTDALTTKIGEIEAYVEESAETTAAALVDLNSRLVDVEEVIDNGVGVMSVTKGTDGNFVTTTIGGTAADPTVGVAVTYVDATDKTSYVATGLATDAYVNEKIAGVNDSVLHGVASEGATIQVGERNEETGIQNIELVWSGWE